MNECVYTRAECHHQGTKCSECPLTDLICDEFTDCLDLSYEQGKADAIAGLKSLLRCRNYRGCAAGKGCDGVCSIDSDICKSCENFGIPYSLLEQMQKEGK